MPDASVRKVTIFVSSPVDVAPERGRVQAVASKLNREYEGLVRFETVLWEDQFYKADKSFQPQITEAVACDVVVSIFWTRIGTELPADFPRMSNGRPYPSGTAYELLTALEASKAKAVPDVYVFRKTADAVLSTADTERRRQAQNQLDAMEAFWSEWFKGDTGEFKAAFQNFPSTDAFEEQVELLLRQWLQTHGLLGRRLAWPKEKGSPFRGLAPFEAEHAAVFFGRARVVDEARRRLVAAAERGAPFLLIVGASGSGKSSLARAGLIPRLTTPGVVTSNDVWRVAQMKPSEGGASPLMALATALYEAGALPELTQGDYPSPATLADNLRHGGEASVQPIVRAIARIGEAAQRERHADRPMKPALILLADQFEELFAQGVSDPERAEFAECLKQLVASGRVWCVATMRADLYDLLLKQPVLKALKETGAALDLGPPGPAELAEIVRAPTQAAGLVFERDTEKGELDERLLADAETADSLPLLQFTLRQLYDRRVEADGEVRLTHAAYDALGGLQGAIAAEAEQAVSKLPPASLETLPRLLRRLAEPARDGGALTLREVPQTDTAADSGEAALVDALLGARILIARTDARGRPAVRLAHSAVLASWPRAKDAAQASRDFYRVRSEVEEEFRRWQEHDRPKDRLIQPGVPLAEADKLVQDFGRELPPELTAYVSASRNRARTRQRWVAAAAVFFFVLAIAATATGVMAYRAQQEAIAERDRATRNFELARGTAERLVFEIASGLRNVQGMSAQAVRKVLEAARATFEPLAASAPNDLPLQRSLAAMLDQFGDTYVTLGDLPEALKACREGLAIMERLTKADPANTGWQRDLSILYSKVGDVLLPQGKVDDALSSYRNGLAIAERLAAADPGSTEWQRNLSTAYERIGVVVQTQGRLDEAIKIYRDNLAVRERLAATEPGNTLWQRDLSISHNAIGDVLVLQGQLDPALASYRDSLAIVERLAASDRTNTQWQFDLSWAYGKVGDVLKAQGKIDDALKFYRDSLAIPERLVAADPDNTQWQHDLEVSYDKIGSLLASQGKIDDALKAHRQSLAIAEYLAATNPGNAVWQRDVVVSQDKIASIAESQGKLDDALEAYRNSLAITNRLVEANPGNTEWQRDLSVSYDKVGIVLEAQGKLDDALEVYRDSLAVRTRLVATDPSNAGWQRDLSWSHEKVGDLLKAQGKVADALKAYRDGLAVRERLAATDPANTGWQRELSSSQERIGDLLDEPDTRDDALKAYRDSLAIRLRLAAADPGDMGLQREVSLSYERVGIVLVAQGKLDDGLAAHRGALAIRTRLAAADPANTESQRELSMSHERIGEALDAQGRRDDALTAYRDSLAVRARVATAGPDNVEWQRDLSSAYERVAIVLVAQGKLDDALAAYRDVLAVRARVAAADPDDAEWKRELSLAHDRIGEILLAQGKLDDALAAHRDALAIHQALIAGDASNPLLQKDLQFSVSRIGGLAYRLVLVRDFAKALEAADQAISLASGTIWLYTNRAHALMFLGRLDEARALYLQYRGVGKVQEDKSWNTAVLEDFAELRKAGLAHRLMDEIERRFAAGG